MAALSEKKDAMQCLSFVELERDSTLRCDTVLESSLAAKDAKLQAAEHVTKE